MSTFSNMYSCTPKLSFSSVRNRIQFEEGEYGAILDAVKDNTVHYIHWENVKSQLHAEKD